MGPDKLTGTAEWGVRGSVHEHAMYVEAISSRCRCRHNGCKKRITHMAAANGIGLSWGCEFHAHRFAAQMNKRRLARPAALKEDNAP